MKVYLGSGFFFYNALEQYYDITQLLLKYENLPFSPRNEACTKFSNFVQNFCA